MSYQPQPPMGAVAPPPSKGKRSLMIGLALIVVGGGVGVALIGLSGSTEEETVKKFARAPAGCTTTLEFDKSTEFTFYIETKGHVGDVGGDCAGNGSSYNRSDMPTVALTLTDPDGNDVSLSDARSTTYSAGDFAGEAYQTARIDSTGTYRLTVASESSDFAIAVGGDPQADSNMMKTGGIIAAAAGVVLGLLVLLLGRRSGGGTASPAPAWQPAAPAGSWPAQPGVPRYQPVPGFAPAPPPPSPPSAPPAPPSGPGWGAPQQ